MVNLREKASLSKTNIFYEFVLFFVEIPLSLVWFVFFFAWNFFVLRNSHLHPCAENATGTRQTRSYW